jgi:hypothetical protein
MVAERERLLQFQEYQNFLMEKKRIEDVWFKSVSDHWLKKENEDTEHWQLSGPRADAVRQFLKLLTVYDIIEAIDSCYQRLSWTCGESRRLKYFCGVCWKMVKRNQEAKS